MNKNNDFWLSAVLYIEEKKKYYISILELKTTTKMLKNLLKHHTRGINKIEKYYKSNISFNFTNEINQIKKVYELKTTSRFEFIFILQETQQRILSMIDTNTLSKVLKVLVDKTIDDGEIFNNFIRENLMSLEKENDQEGYTETTDMVADLITDLFFYCKVD